MVRVITILAIASLILGCGSSGGDTASGGSGGGGGATDTTAPIVSSTTPSDAATSIAITTTVKVVFGEAMDTATITAPTTATCGGTLQVSSDNFATCVAMSSATPAASDANAAFTMTPAASLANSTVYKIRVTTAAKDASANALAAQYTSTTGFTTVAGGDVTPPTVSSTTPTDAATGVALSTTIAVTFSEAMDTATITAPTTATCGGTLQVSPDNFVTCVAMSSGTPTASGGNTVFTMTPSANLSSLKTYKVRVTTAAKDASANAIAAQYTSATGFTTLYSHTIAIDGTNDFNISENEFASSNTGKLYVSYDKDNVYVALTHADIQAGGAGGGNKFVYVIFNSDGTLATGSTNSSDSKAVFGASKKMQYSWKERVDGANYTEYQSAPGGTWAAWTSGGASNRAAGFVEASIPRASFGSPSKLQITFYIIDYNGDSGKGWLYNMLNGATDGTGNPARDLVKYVEIDFSASKTPNDAANIKNF